MAKFPEADARLFRNMFVCRRCKTKMRTSNMMVIAGRVSCRKCQSHVFRPVRKK